MAWRRWLFDRGEKPQDVEPATSPQKEGGQAGQGPKRSESPETKAWLRLGVSLHDVAVLRALTKEQLQIQVNPSSFEDDVNTLQRALDWGGYVICLTPQRLMDVIMAWIKLRNRGRKDLSYLDFAVHLEAMAIIREELAIPGVASDLGNVPEARHNKVIRELTAEARSRQEKAKAVAQAHILVFRPWFAERGVPEAELIAEGRRLLEEDGRRIRATLGTAEAKIRARKGLHQGEKIPRQELWQEVRQLGSLSLLD